MKWVCFSLQIFNLFHFSIWKSAPRSLFLFASNTMQMRLNRLIDISKWEISKQMHPSNHLPYLYIKSIITMIASTQGFRQIDVDSSRSPLFIKLHFDSIRTLLVKSGFQWLISFLISNDGNKWVFGVAGRSYMLLWPSWLEHLKNIRFCTADTCTNVIVQ